MAPERNDVDAALESLEAELLEDVSAEINEIDLDAIEVNETSANETPSEADEAEPEESTNVGPPELPARRATGRRTIFDDLFAAESTPTSAVHGSPEEKIEYFRNKLKAAETAMARVRDAWEVREREVDGFESVMQQAQRRAEEAAQQRVTLEQFFETKKQEFTEYIAGVTRAFAEKDEVEKSLRAHLAELRTETEAHGEALQQSQDELRDDLDEAAAALERAMTQADELRQELADTREALGHDIELRDEAIAKLKRIVEDQRASVFERDATIERQMDTAASQEHAAARLLAEKARLEGALRAKSDAGQAEDGVEHVREALGRDIAERDFALEGARTSIDELRETVRERDATIAELRDELALLADRVNDAEAEGAGSQQQHRADDQGADAVDLTRRDATIAKLRATMEEQQRVMAERDLKIETLELQAAEARRDALRAAEQVMQQAAPTPNGPNVKTVRLQKALHLADRLFFDLESGHAALFSDRDGTGEMLTRLRKAVALARKAAEML